MSAFTGFRGSVKADTRHEVPKEDDFNPPNRHLYLT